MAANTNTAKNNVVNMLIKQEPIIQDGLLPIYNIPLTDFPDNELMIKKYNFGVKGFNNGKKVIMFVGATGSGKTTLINVMMNYILGVQLEDNYCFKLINEKTNKPQTESQTPTVTVYELYHQDGFQVPYSITVIDTPGFGNTRGLERDQEIMTEIEDVFKSPNGLDEIDALCFVAKASINNLTTTEKYIFDCVLSIFGKDIKENIFSFLTFADDRELSTAEIINEYIAPHLDKRDPIVYLKFNNSILFTKITESTKSNDDSDSDEEDSNVFKKAYWKLGRKSMRTFFNLKKTEPKSLSLTKEVLDERRSLECLVQGFHFQLQKNALLLEEIKKTKSALKLHEKEMDANKNFTHEVIETVKYKEKLPDGTYATYCDTCKVTCHFPVVNYGVYTCVKLCLGR
nr:PREDICTED: uncharacterized protein LOC102360679 [Latimeria chalumnae]|eukprot:XP_006003646.1 PREDICTED: uncharacterized protein LOC102360679 [Latimeria chalumnae]